MEDFYQTIIDKVKDLVTDFTYYDRKGDEELSKKQLDNAIEREIISIEEIVEAFKEELESVYRNK